MEIVHEGWAALVSIVLAVLLLYSQVCAQFCSSDFESNTATKATWPAFLPLALTICLFAIAAYISQGVGTAQGLWLASTDKRVKYLTSVLHNYLPMKWSRYEDVVGARAAELRAEEMKGAHTF
jgi:ATP-binding cassette subfamily C (CFTR/MRP) protein 1